MFCSTGLCPSQSICVSQKKAKQSNKLVTDLESRTVKEQLKGFGLFILGKKRTLQDGYKAVKKIRVFIKQ